MTKRTRTDGLAAPGHGAAEDLDAMLAAQLGAAHGAAMDGYRRAAACPQADERHRELGRADRFARTFAALAETRSRQRGLKSRTITVDYVRIDGADDDATQPGTALAVPGGGPEKR